MVMSFTLYGIIFNGYDTIPYMLYEHFSVDKMIVRHFIILMQSECKIT